MLRVHVRRRLSDRLDGITHGPEGSVDKLLMTWVEQAVGHAPWGSAAPATRPMLTTRRCASISTAVPRASWAEPRRSNETSSPLESWDCLPHDL